jgi:hypothetical protein
MAKERYCWRCDAIVPMLTEQEWEVMEPALTQAISEVQGYRAAHGASLEQALSSNPGRSALRLYQDLTGYAEPIQMQSGTIASQSTVRLANRVASRFARHKPRSVPLAERGPNKSFKPNPLRGSA